MRSRHTSTRVLICAALTWAMSGCASSPRPMADPEPPPAALTVPCPELPPAVRDLAKTLQGALLTRVLYRLCALRLADLVKAVTPPNAEE